MPHERVLAKALLLLLLLPRGPRLPHVTLLMLTVRGGRCLAELLGEPAGGSGGTPAPLGIIARGGGKGWVGGLQVLLQRLELRDGVAGAQLPRLVREETDGTFAFDAKAAQRCAVPDGIDMGAIINKGQMQDKHSMCPHVFLTWRWFN